MHVLVLMENKTAVAYVNKMGGTVSKVLSNIATLLWNWCLDRQITLTAEYIPGAKNSIADWECRNFLDKTSWRLNPQIFKQLQVLLGLSNVDLFTDKTNYQRKRYFSWKPNPHAESFDAFIQDLRTIKGYAFPPFCLIGMSKIRDEQSEILIITPT